MSYLSEASCLLEKVEMDVLSKVRTTLQWCAPPYMDGSIKSKVMDAVELSTYQPHLQGKQHEGWWAFKEKYLGWIWTYAGYTVQGWSPALGIIHSYPIATSPDVFKSLFCNYMISMSVALFWSSQASLVYGLWYMVSWYAAFLNLLNRAWYKEAAIAGLYIFQQAISYNSAFSIFTQYINMVVFFSFSRLY